MLEITLQNNSASVSLVLIQSDTNIIPLSKKSSSYESLEVLINDFINI